MASQKNEKADKIKIMKGADPDLSAATYQLFDETHTMGNALRWMIMKNPKVEFCGYRFVLNFCSQISHAASSGDLSAAADEQSAPHPSENLIQLRIQMYDKESSLDALLAALEQLDEVCETIGDAYTTSLQKNEHEVWEEKS